MIDSRAMAFHATPCGCSACVLAIGTIGVDLIGEQHRPLERLHAAERAPGDRREPFDAELVEERALGPHHVGDGDHREVRAVRAAGRRVDRRRARRAAAAAEQVRGDDVVAVGVERLARPDHPVPPAEPLAGRAVAVGGAEPVPRALRGRRLRDARRVGVAAERVAHQDHVVPPRRQGAVGLVGDADRVQLPPAVECAPVAAGRGTGFRQRRPSRPRASRLALPWGYVSSPMSGVLSIRLHRK